MFDPRGINPPLPDQAPVIGIVTLTGPGGGATSQKTEFPDMENCTSAGKALIDSKSLAVEVDCIDVRDRSVNTFQSTTQGTRVTGFKY